MSDLAVWFDLDGTLLAVDDYGAVLDRACEECGVNPTDRFRDAYDRQFFTAFEDHHPEPFRVGAEAAFDATGCRGDPATFVAALQVAEFDAAETPRSVHDALADLAGTDGISVGVLTNGLPDWQGGKLAANGLDGHVDATLTSYEVGAHKPAPAAFDRAETLLPADEHVMVGDDIEADVTGAREYGWRAVHVEGPESVADAVSGLR